ncbi:hypothetical protein DEO72_LG10g2552 [Vigna unguiculata]|uniref:Uncharacterized protein n=1 Tax=Vigna unguiculata TaxID=3917 RepID=A0A4D6NFK6_VIGUN|nr:hypothetical protein DEO72_LG10g2552 [Vigna unguiculata]
MLVVAGVARGAEMACCHGAVAHRRPWSRFANWKDGRTDSNRVTKVNPSWNHDNRAKNKENVVRGLTYVSRAELRAILTKRGPNPSRAFCCEKERV